MMHEKLKYDLRKNLNNHVNKDLRCNSNRIESSGLVFTAIRSTMFNVITIELTVLKTDVPR